MTTAKAATAAPSESNPDAGSSGDEITSTDAIELLTQDHKEVRALFDEYAQLVDDGAEDDVKLQLAQEICVQLAAHATVEEEIFYPAARESLSDEDQQLINEAEVEHGSARELIAQIEDSTPEQDDLFDTKVKVLGDYIEQHVRDEEDDMFPKLRESDLDLNALGEEIAERKEELLIELTVEAQAD